MRRAAILALVMLASLGGTTRVLADEKYTPSHLAAAGELIDALGIQTELQDKIVELETKRFKSLHAGASDAVVADYVAAFTQGVRLEPGSGRAVYESFYAERFTEPELKALAEFYRSDLGRKYQAAQPDIQESVHILMIGVELMIKTAREKAEADLHAKGELP